MSISETYLDKNGNIKHEAVLDDAIQAVLDSSKSNRRVPLEHEFPGVSAIVYQSDSWEPNTLPYLYLIKKLTAISPISVLETFTAVKPYGVNSPSAQEVFRQEYVADAINANKLGIDLPHGERVIFKYSPTRKPVS
jgi:hypothetical protein